MKLFQITAVAFALLGSAFANDNNSQPLGADAECTTTTTEISTVSCETSSSIVIPEIVTEYETEYITISSLELETIYETIKSTTTLSSVEMLTETFLNSITVTSMDVFTVTETNLVPVTHTIIEPRPVYVTSTVTIPIVTTTRAPVLSAPQFSSDCDTVTLTTEPCSTETETLTTTDCISEPTDAPVSTA